jgi:hypothetical protein
MRLISRIAAEFMAEALAILAQPSRPEHAAYAETFGDDFDPEAFSLNAINAALSGTRFGEVKHGVR